MMHLQPTHKCTLHWFIPSFIFFPQYLSLLSYSLNLLFMLNQFIIIKVFFFHFLFWKYCYVIVSIPVFTLKRLFSKTIWEKATVEPKQELIIHQYNWSTIAKLHINHVVKKWICDFLYSGFLMIAACVMTLEVNIHKSSCLYDHQVIITIVIFLIIFITIVIFRIMQHV